MPDFQSLRAAYGGDNDYPERAHRIDALTRVLEGTLYDHLAVPFSEEKNPAGEYVPLDRRRPSARTRFCRRVVDDSVALLFGDGHFPALECEDEAQRDGMAAILKDSHAAAVLTEAATRGSVGSVAIWLRVLKGRVYWQALATEYLTPEWQADAPDELARVTERYKVKGKELAARGYTIPADKLSVDFWFQREWNAAQEVWFEPISVLDAKEGKEPSVDAARTVSHAMGFVPMLWLRNLPGGDEIDGAPTFPVEAINAQIEADYLLSQGGRGLKYQSDPTLHIKEPAFSEQKAVVKGAANAIVTSNDGDVKLLEISGDGPKAVLEWVKGLREIALEAAGGNRSNADKLSAAQSGRAMELMNQALIWLADKLRTSYGERGLLRMVEMITQASARWPLKDRRGRDLPKIAPDATFTLRWPAWFAPTFADQQTQAQALDILRNAGLLSRETGVKVIAPTYDIADPADEVRQIDADPPPPGAVPPEDKKKPSGESQD